MLYTKKGDNGTTKLFNCKQGERLSKSSAIFEVLGMVDELNTTIGFAKALSVKSKDTLFFKGKKISYEDILEKIQQILFSIQAELGGSHVRIKPEHVIFLEDVVYEVETVIPPISSFIVYGGGETGAYLDIVRAVARRAERQVISLRDKEKQEISQEAIQFLNRLSSALFALARHANYQEGFLEQGPNYK